MRNSSVSSAVWVEVIALLTSSVCQQPGIFKTVDTTPPSGPLPPQLWLANHPNPLLSLSLLLNSTSFIPPLSFPNFHPVLLSLLSSPAVIYVVGTVEPGQQHLTPQRPAPVLQTLNSQYHGVSRGKERSPVCPVLLMWSVSSGNVSSRGGGGSPGMPPTIIIL